MRPLSSALLLVLVVALPESASAQPASTERPKPAQLAPDSLERARKFTLWLYTNQTDSLFAYMDTTRQRELNVPNALEETVAELASRAGSEEQLLEERWVTRNGRRQSGASAGGKPSSAASPIPASSAG
jgi:hypothetical protein